MKVQKGVFVLMAFFSTLLIFVTDGYSFTITSSAGLGGSISPSGDVTVSAGANQTFTITPDQYFGVLDVWVDGVSVGKVLSYDFNNVADDHTIFASFGCAYPVMLENDLSTFATVMEAYDHATINLGLNDFTLMLTAETWPEEDIYFDAFVSVFLDGGYDCQYLNNNMMTRIPGSLTVADGTTVTSNIILSSPPPCQPGDPNNFPGNQEICDGLDNNCNGLIDDGLTFDADGDGYTAVGSCNGSADDCNDNDPSIHPFGEIYGDGIDQDCDGQDLLLLFPVDDGDCFDCHSIDLVNNLSHKDHQYTVPPDDTCVNCHAAQVSSILTGHYGKTVLTAGNNMGEGDIISCTSCHDWHDLYENPAYPKLDYIVWAKVHAVPPVEPFVSCDTCHENRAAVHATGTAHDHRIIDTNCANCHTSDTTVLGSPGTGTLTSQADVDTLHRSDCTLCHDYNGTKIWAVTVKQAIEDGMNGTDISCLDCHSDKTTGHGSVDHAALGYVTGGSTICLNCHDPGTVENGTVSEIHNGICSHCHTTVPNLQPGIPDGGGDCITCHGDYFPNHNHHNSTNNDVSYNADVDTSQSSELGCAFCHHDYDNVNGTSVGLGTWSAILVEHDLDGTKDGSTNTCDNCHAYDGSGPTPLADVQNAIASGNPATCATCHTDKVPDVNHAIPQTGKHEQHFEMANMGCDTCHDISNFPYFKSGTDGNGDGQYDLSETDVCNLCHQDWAPDLPPEENYKTGWSEPGFQLACNSCHGIAPATGSHQAHYDGTDDTLAYGDLRITEDFMAGQVSSTNMLGCGNCHPLDISFHGNQNWGDVELYNNDEVNHPELQDSIKQKNPNNASYDQQTNTCSSVYCHSVNSWTTNGSVPMPWPDPSVWVLTDPLPRPLPANISTVRDYKDVIWGNTLTCNGCHGNPPQTSYVDNDGGAGDSHYWVDQYGYGNLHVYNLGFPPIGCRTCHYDTVQAWDEENGWNEDPLFYNRTYNDVAIYDKAKHVNGSVNVAFDTVNNFEYFSLWSGRRTPINLSIASFDTATRTCSNVECHMGLNADDKPKLETDVTWGLPYRWWDNTECDRCHGYTGSPMGDDCVGCHFGGPPE